MKTWKLATIMSVFAAVAVGADKEVPKTEPPAAKIQGSTAPSPGKVGPTITLDLGGGIALETVLIPAGKFLMGEKEDRVVRGEYLSVYPQHEVTISKSFFMGKYEVTQEQYEKVMGKNPSGFKHPVQPPSDLPKGSPEAKAAEKAAKEAAAKDPTEFPKNPVEMINETDAQTFCDKVSQMTGKIVRLPTEAEWDWACRAGSYDPPDSKSFDQAFLDGVAWWKGNSDNKTHPVGLKKPNAWGLYDMYGNVWERCQDLVGIYDKESVIDPQGPKETTIDGKSTNAKKTRIIRGGCYGNPFLQQPNWSNWANMRFGHSPVPWLGFRVVVEVPKAP